MKKYDDETTKILESIVRLQVIETVSLRNSKTLLTPGPPPPARPPAAATRGYTSSTAAHVLRLIGLTWTQNRPSSPRNRLASGAPAT